MFDFTQCPLCSKSEKLSVEAADAIYDALEGFMHSNEFGYASTSLVTELTNIRNVILNIAERRSTKERTIDPLLL